VDRPPLEDLQHIFYSAFVPGAAELSADISDLLLELKTQALLTRLAAQGQTSPNELLVEQVFLGDLEDQLRQRHPDSDLTECEEGLLASAQAKKEFLLESFNESCFQSKF
jgi:hypothetical protein